MAYFQMDDGTDTELRVLQAGTAAFGLYARCGVWAARNLTDGFVPEQIAALYGTREWIEKLVASGLWTLEDGGFGMPDYLESHGNKTAEVVRKRRADAAARQQKLREGRKHPNTSRGMSRVTNAGSNAGSHGSLSDPPPKGGEEGGPALRAGAAPPSSTPTRTLTSGRVICATHHQEIPDNGTCRSCAADLIAANVDDDLDQRPPSRDELRAQLAANRGKHTPPSTWQGPPPELAETQDGP